MTKEFEIIKGIDNNDVNFDPVTAFSYIDERLQIALGDLQKDFAQVMSPEMLGPKFGEYGSFLPTHKHHSALHSHGKALSFYIPFTPQLEEARLHNALGHLQKDFEHQLSTEISGPKFDEYGSFLTPHKHPRALDSHKKDLTFNNLCSPQLEGAPDPKNPLTLVKTNEICDDLGLPTLPSLNRNSPKNSGDPPPKSNDIPSDSPSSILNAAKPMTKLEWKRKYKLTGIHSKNSDFKDIVKVRNSYSGTKKAESVERSRVPAKVTAPQQTEMGSATPQDNWVECDGCQKWRLLPIHIDPDNLPDKWLCSMSTWLPGRNHCEVEEDETTKAVQEMNLLLIAENQDSFQPNKMRRVVMDVNAKTTNNGKIARMKQTTSEAKPGYTGSPERMKRKLKKVSVDPKVEVPGCGQNQSKVKLMKHQNAKRLVADCDMKNHNVANFLNEIASSERQTALTALKRAQESKDHADRLKVSSGYDHECNNAYFDSALMFLFAASLLDACNAGMSSKSNGVDTINVYTTAAKLFETCAEEFQKQKELVASVLAYKCMDVSCMKIVYRQDLQTGVQMVTQNKTSMKSQNAYKSACAILEKYQNKELIDTVKRDVNFCIQDVRGFVHLVQNPRGAVNRHGSKGNKRQ